MSRMCAIHKAATLSASQTQLAHQGYPGACKNPNSQSEAWTNYSELGFLRLFRQGQCALMVWVHCCKWKVVQKATQL